MKPKLRVIRSTRLTGTRFTRKQAAAAVKAVMAMRERGEFDDAGTKPAPKVKRTAADRK